MVYTNKLSTEKDLILKYQSLSSENSKIYYMYNRPFSAQYYSHGKAILVGNKVDTKKYYLNFIARDAFQTILDNDEKKFVVIQKKVVKQISKGIKKPLKKIFENKQFVLFEI